MAKHRRGDILAGGLITAMGLLLLGGAWWTGNRQYTILKSWPTVEAEVTKSKVNLIRESHNSLMHYTRIEFRFDADGKQFTASSSERSGTLGGAQMTAHTHAPGTRHTIRYNSANPNDIRFNADETIMFFSTPIVLGLAGLALTGGGLRWLWRARRSKSKP
jgi:Protein of unknown function (DUF3592)